MHGVIFLGLAVRLADLGNEPVTQHIGNGEVGRWLPAIRFGQQPLIESACGPSHTAL